MTRQPIIRITLSTDPDERLPIGDLPNITGGVCPCPPGTHMSTDHYAELHGSGGYLQSISADVSLGYPVDGITPAEIIGALQVSVNSPDMLAQITAAYDAVRAKRN